MGVKLDLYRETRDAARREASAANIRQDNITRRGNQVLSPTTPFNTPTRDNYQTYPYDYFSGTDAKIFFGDVWVDDIVTIQYNVNQAKNPIWGYASQYFDAVARGIVMVQGSLSIAFKETGYLNIIQAMLEKQRSGRAINIKNTLEKVRLRAENGVGEFIPGMSIGGDENSEVVYASNGTPQFIRQSQTIEEILHGKISSSVAVDFGLSPKERDFEDFAELLQDTIWGDSNGRPLEAELKKKLRRADEFDYNSKGGIQVGREPYSDVLNILLTFGDINDFRAEHTLVSINDVHFTAQGMVVSPDGVPIAETFNFFARNINSSIGGTSTYKINPIKLETGADNIQLSKLEAIDALENQLVKERVPQYMRIVATAALVRGGKWKALSGKDAFTILMDQVTVPGNYADEVNSASEQIKKYESRDSRRGERKTKEAQGKKDALIQNWNTAYQFVFNGHEPLVDQIISYVEREFNEFDGAKAANGEADIPDLRNSQYIVDVEFRNSSNGPRVSKLTMVLSQSIPDSRTYRVISPTRQNFGAANIVSREDLFSDIKPIAEFQEELSIMDKEMQTKYKAQNDKRSEFDDSLDLAVDARATELQKNSDRLARQIKELKQQNDESAMTDNSLLDKQKQKIALDAQIEELNNDTFSDEDATLLRRRDQGDFTATLRERDEAAKQAEFYEEQSDSLNVTKQKLIDDNLGEMIGIQNAELNIKLAAQNIISADILSAPTSLTLPENNNGLVLEANKKLIAQSNDKLVFNENDITTMSVDLNEHNTKQIQKLLLENRIRTKYQPDPTKAVDYTTFSQKAIAGVLKARDVIESVTGRKNYTEITSATDNLDLHKFDSKHITGNAFDLKSKNLGPHQKYEVLLLLRAQLGSDYTINLEYRELENEHFHIQYNL